MALWRQIFTALRQNSHLIVLYRAYKNPSIFQETKPCIYFNFCIWQLHFVRFGLNAYLVNILATLILTPKWAHVLSVPLLVTGWNIAHTLVCQIYNWKQFIYVSLSCDLPLYNFEPTYLRWLNYWFSRNQSWFKWLKYWPRPTLLHCSFLGKDRGFRF